MLAPFRELVVAGALGFQTPVQKGGIAVGQSLGKHSGSCREWSVLRFYAGGRRRPLARRTLRIP
jgi:hypothetical protein